MIEQCFNSFAVDPPESFIDLLWREAKRAVRRFAAAAKLRYEMGAQMSGNDRQEYENYLTMVHDHLDRVTFEAE